MICLSLSVWGMLRGQRKHTRMNDFAAFVVTFLDVVLRSRHHHPQDLIVRLGLLDLMQHLLQGRHASITTYKGSLSSMNVSRVFISSVLFAAQISINFVSAEIGRKN